MDISDKILRCSDRALFNFIFNNFKDHQEMVDFFIYYLNEPAQDCIARFFRNDCLLRTQIFADIEDKILFNKLRIKYKKSLDIYNRVLDNCMAECESHKNTGYILLTDIVDSTTKINSLGDNDYYENVLLKHNKILQKSIKYNEGRIIKNIGDAYLAVFTNKINALKACIEAQLEFEEINNGRDIDKKILVRMALHKGDYSLKSVENSYIDIFGSSVNYAARMVACTGGGQISVSQEFIAGWQISETCIEKVFNSSTSEYVARKKYIDEEELENDDVGDDPIAYQHRSFKYITIEDTSVSIYDPQYFEIINHLLKEFHNKISFKSFGQFSFKGFDIEQELFNVNYHGDISTLKNIDELIKKWIQQSLARESRMKVTGKFIMAKSKCDPYGDDRIILEDNILNLDEVLLEFDEDENLICYVREDVAKEKGIEVKEDEIPFYVEDNLYSEKEF